MHRHTRTHTLTGSRTRIHVVNTKNKHGCTPHAPTHTLHLCVAHSHTHLNTHSGIQLPLPPLTHTVHAHVHSPPLTHLLAQSYTEIHTESHPHSDTLAHVRSELLLSRSHVTDPSSHFQNSSSFDKIQLFHLAHEWLTSASLPLPTQ